MKKLLIVLTLLMSLLTPALAENTWTGVWGVEWRTGGSTIKLEQQGRRVTGNFLSGQGQLEAEVEGAQIKGTVTYEGGSETFTATLASDGQSFSGRTATGNWLSSQRLVGAADRAEDDIDLHSPRAAMSTFLAAANGAHEGKVVSWSLAADAVDFENLADAAAPETRYAYAEKLFDAIDLATFELSGIPENTVSTSVVVSLPQINGKSKIEITIKRGGDGNWRLVLPPEEKLQAMLEGAPRRTADGFRKLKSPRDTVIAFLDGMRRWAEHGDHDAMETIDLSAVPEALKSEQGRLTSQYLIRIIDQTGAVLLQSIPNSGDDRKRYVYFRHPAGSIVIEPVDADGKTKWQFSQETLRTAPILYRAVQELPGMHALDERMIPPSNTFWLRQMVRKFLPILDHDMPGGNGVEYWQALAIILVITLEFAIMFCVRALCIPLFRQYRVARHIEFPTRLATAIGICVATVIGWRLVPEIGLPASVRQFTLPILGTLIITVSAYTAWQMISALSSVIQAYTEDSQGHFDRTPLAFAVAVMRMSVIVIAGYSLGLWWSIPTNSLLAGLGIGGLALALASKKTLASIFGTGILLSDRPFRTGDCVIAGEINGVVEEVGMRSTRVRAPDDSILVVPNDELAHMPINNLGARRRHTYKMTLLVGTRCSVEELQEFVDAVRNRILSDSVFLSNSTEVHLSGITKEGVEVEIATALTAASANQHKDATHELLLSILKLADERGLSLRRLN